MTYRLSLQPPSNMVAALTCPLERPNEEMMWQRNIFAETRPLRPNHRD
jgi:hypothetical protein